MYEIIVKVNAHIPLATIKSTMSNQDILLWFLTQFSQESTRRIVRSP